jgi:hypothetical protein
MIGPRETTTMRGSIIAVDQIGGPSSHVFLGSSPDRVGLIFFAPRVGVLTVKNTPIASQDDGVVLTPGMTALRMYSRSLGDLTDDGDCVKREWYVLASGGAAPIVFAQIFA